MVKIYSTLGRKFNKKDLEEAQRMGQELVCHLISYLSLFIEIFIYIVIAKSKLM